MVWLLTRADAGDLDLRQQLTMAALPVRVLAPLLLEGDDFVRALLRDDLGRDGGARKERRPDFAARHQHFAKLDGSARVARQALDLEHVALRDSVLFAAGADDREHGSI